MSNKKTLRNFSQPAKPSNKKGQLVRMSPAPLPFKTAQLPDWVALVLFDLVSSPKTSPVVYIKSFPKLSCSLGLSYDELESALADSSLADQYIVYSNELGKEQKLLEDYLQKYEAGKLPVQQYKTFEKSMRATIDVLCTGEKIKGKAMGLDYIPAPASDVRFYSSLVYLWRQKLLNIVLPSILQVGEVGTVADVEIKLKVSAQSMASRVLPPPPDASYDGLELFLDEKKLIYQGNTSHRLQSERPMCKILKYMMQHPAPVSLKQMRTKFAITTTKNDPAARGKIDNFIYRANLRLHKVKFPQRLCITEKKICWKDVDS